jgi:hypothetical protein
MTVCSQDMPYVFGVDGRRRVLNLVTGWVVVRACDGSS